MSNNLIEPDPRTARKYDIALQLDTRHIFPIEKMTHAMKTRMNEQFEFIHANTERLKKSTVPYIQRMLNQLARMFMSSTRSLPFLNHVCTVPVKF